LRYRCLNPSIGGRFVFLVVEDHLVALVLHVDEHHAFK
jgi:hypothetical protein